MIAMIIRLAYDGPPGSYTPKEQPMLGCVGCKQGVGLVREGLRGFGASMPANTSRYQTPDVLDDTDPDHPEAIRPPTTPTLSLNKASAAFQHAQMIMANDALVFASPAPAPAKMWPLVLAGGAVAFYFLFVRK